MIKTHVFRLLERLTTLMEWIASKLILQLFLLLNRNLNLISVYMFSLTKDTNLYKNK
jgi:hypothetical protein